MINSIFFFFSERTTVFSFKWAHWHKCTRPTNGYKPIRMYLGWVLCSLWPLSQIKTKFACNSSPSQLSISHFFTGRVCICLTLLTLSLNWRFAFILDFFYRSTKSETISPTSTWGHWGRRRQYRISWGPFEERSLAFCWSNWAFLLEVCSITRNDAVKLYDNMWNICKILLWFYYLIFCVMLPFCYSTNIFVSDI